MRSSNERPLTAEEAAFARAAQRGRAETDAALAMLAKSYQLRQWAVEQAVKSMDGKPHVFPIVNNAENGTVLYSPLIDLSKAIFEFILPSGG